MDRVLAVLRDVDEHAAIGQSPQFLFKDVTPAELATFIKVVDLVLAGVRSSQPEAGQSARLAQ